MDRQTDDKHHFVDIILERRLTSDIKWASNEWVATVANKQFKKYCPKKIKNLVQNSYRLQRVLKKINQERQVPLNELNSIVQNILDEIGYDRKVPILRWLGFFVAKVLKRLFLAVYVNESKFLQIKSDMGRNPLLFVPTHRSYFDFILMSYICFHYKVDIPRIAAGMDFQSMTLLGNILRDACAFFMRRSFVEDELYHAVFSQYVQTLIIYGDAAIEFFIEGTRSRTQKSLMPKYGFLSMTLKPFLTGLVPDITVVPVNISYDRVLEEVLFAYELLGVPKPKESTKGFIKALNVLSENYGNVYVQFGEPISVKKYFSNKLDRSIHSLGAIEMQEITPTETKFIINLAHSIVRTQRELTSINCFNLIAAILNNCLSTQSEPPYLNKLCSEVQWLFSIFQTLAPTKAMLTLDSITQQMVLQHLNIHKSIIHLSADEKIQFLRIHSTVGINNLEKLKGHELADTTMDIAIPILMLQYYVNPCASFLISVCFIALVIESLTEKNWISSDELLREFEFLYSVFSFEFILHTDFIQEDFNAALHKGNLLRIINLRNGNTVEKGNNKKLSSFLISFLNSYIPGYITVIEIIAESTERVLTEKQILKTSQQRLESKLNNDHSLHPANLSLDLLVNALQSFVAMKAVAKEKGKNGFEYRANQKELQKIRAKLKPFDFSNRFKANLSQLFSVFVKATL